MQYWAAPRLERGLADPVLVEEVLHDLQAPALAAEDRAVRDPDVVQA